MNGLAAASFLAFGALLVLFGSNASEIIDRLSLDYQEFGLVASMLSLGLGVGILSAGPLVDRLPRRPLFVAACLVVASAALSLGSETRFSLLLAASFAIGLGAGFYETLLNAVIVEQSGAGAPRRLLFIHAAATLGASVTPFMIGWLREPLALAWYDTFRAAGLAHLALIFAVPLLPKKASRTAPAAEQSAPGDRAVDPAPESEAPDRRGRFLLATICLVTFAYVGLESAYTFFIADYAANVLGLPSARSTGVVGFFWSGLLAGRLAVGFSSREPSAITTALLASGAALICGFFFGFGAASSDRFLFPPEVAAAVTGFCLGGVFPIMIGLAGRALPRSAGTAVGLAGGLGSLGGFLIPLWTGALAKQAGLGIGLGSLTGWLLLLAGAAYAVHRQGQLPANPGGL